MNRFTAYGGNMGRCMDDPTFDPCAADDPPQQGVSAAEANEAMVQVAKYSALDAKITQEMFFKMQSHLEQRLLKGGIASVTTV